MKGQIVREDGALKRLCYACKTAVESTLGTAFRTKPEELILCPECGADNSLAPSLKYRLKRARKLAHRRRLAYGFFWWIKGKPWTCLMLDRELERRVQRKAVA